MSSLKAFVSFANAAANVAAAGLAIVAANKIANAVLDLNALVNEISKDQATTCTALSSSTKKGGAGTTPPNPSEVNDWNVDGVKIPSGRNAENHPLIVAMGEYLSFLGPCDAEELRNVSKYADDIRKVDGDLIVVRTAKLEGFMKWSELAVRDRLIIGRIVRCELRIAACVQPTRDVLMALDMVHDLISRYAHEYGLEPKWVDVWDDDCMTTNLADSD